MSDNDKKDLTRIEDLSDFFHSEDDDDLSDIEAALSSDDVPPDFPTDDDEFSDMATDPDIHIPEGLNEQELVETDFTALEDNDDEDSFETNDDFTSEEEDSFETNDDFTSDDEDSFETSDDFSIEEEDSFETSDDFASDQEDSFEANDDFAIEEEDSFETNDDFASEEEDSFETNDDFVSDDDTSYDDDPIDEEITKSSQEEITSNIPGPEKHNEEKKETPLPENFGDTQKTLLPIMEESDDYKSPENFKELQQFARNMSFGNMAKEGTPPFSIILKDIKYEEDLEDIIRLLVEYKIIENDDKVSARASLERGNMLLPRLGEFAAISLCHKLRRFDINILMGLTEEVNPAKEYESDDRGLTTKNNIYNNKKHSWKFEKQDIQLNDVIVSTTPYIDAHDILEYISIVTESTSIDMANFTNCGQLEEEINIEINKNDQQKNDFYPFSKENEQSKSSVSLNDIYQSLIEKCKTHAINKKGNALIGVNFQITPLLLDDAIHIHSRYQVTCSGSVVWINKR